MTGRVRIERSLAQKDHDAAIHTLLGEMDVSGAMVCFLCQTSFKCRPDRSCTPPALNRGR